MKKLTLSDTSLKSTGRQLLIGHVSKVMARKIRKLKICYFSFEIVSKKVYFIIILRHKPWLSKSFTKKELILTATKISYLPYLKLT